MKKLFLTVSSLFCLLLAAEEKPILKAGIITDTHITPQESSCFWVEKALKFFKKNKRDTHNVVPLLTRQLATELQALNEVVISFKRITLEII